MLKHLLALLAALLVSAGSLADDQALPANVTFTKWQVPWKNSRPRDPMLDSNGHVWFCGQTGNYIGKLDPDSGEFSRFKLSPNTHPHNLIVDDSDNIWYAGNKNAHIGRLDPHTGDVKQFPMPEGKPGDPHTLVFDKSGNIWFTAQWANAIGHLNTKSGKVRVYDIPIEDARPYGIKMDAQNKPWVVLLGSNKLVTIKNDNLMMIDLPREEARLRRLEITRDGKIWYTDYAGGYLGYYAPDAQKFKEWPLPSKDKSMPYASALDNQGRIWVADTASVPNQLYGFSPDTGAFFSQAEVSFGGHIRHTYVDPATGAIWFGTDSGYIAKAMPL